MYVRMYISKYVLHIKYVCEWCIRVKFFLYMSDYIDIELGKEYNGKVVWFSNKGFGAVSVEGFKDEVMSFTGF